MPMDRKKYPANWEKLARAIKDEADWKCEECGKQCRRPCEPFDTHKRTLTVAHLNHKPLDCRRENLKALCAPCHLRYDAAHHAETRRRRKMQHPTIKVTLDEGAYLPERAHGTDAGADIRTPRAFTIAGHGHATIETGVHVETPPNCAAMLKSKSGLNLKHNIIGEGVIDEGFTNQIVVKLYNLGNEDYSFAESDKIIQLVIVPVLYPTYEQADSITGGERGNAGYGSTGR